MRIQSTNVPCDPRIDSSQPSYRPSCITFFTSLSRIEPNRIGNSPYCHLCSKRLYVLIVCSVLSVEPLLLFQLFPPTTHPFNTHHLHFLMILACLSPKPILLHSITRLGQHSLLSYLNTFHNQFSSTSHPDPLQLSIDSYPSIPNNASKASFSPATAFVQQILL